MLHFNFLKNMKFKIFRCPVCCFLVFLVLGCQKTKSFKSQEEKLEILSNVDYTVSDDFSALISNDRESKRITIDIDNYVDWGFRISEISSQSRFVVLDTSDSVLIGDVDEMYALGDDWILSDADISKSIYRFSNNGKFLSKIGKLGEGPGEFLNPTNISVNQKSIFVHSEFQLSVFSYDLMGDFIRDYKVPFLFSDFHLINDQFVFNTANNINGHIPTIANYMLATTDNSLNIQHGSFYFDPDLYNNMRAAFPNQLVRNNEELYYMQPFTSEFYRVDINSLTVEKLFDLDFGDEWPDAKYLKKLIDRDPINLRQQLQDDRKVVVNSYLVSDDYVILKVVYMGRLIKIIISRTTGEVRGGAALVDDMDDLMSIEPMFLIGDQLISVIEPPQFLEMIRGNSETYKKLMSKIPNLDKIRSTDNFILRIHELKK